MVFSVLICLLDCCLGMLAVGFVFDFLSGLCGLMVLSGILMLVFVFTIHLGIAVGFGVFGCGSSGGRCGCVCVGVIWFVVGLGFAGCLFWVGCLCVWVVWLGVLGSLWVAWHKFLALRCGCFVLMWVVLLTCYKFCLLVLLCLVFGVI